MNNIFYEKIAKEISVSVGQVERTAMLLNEGATIPFIARYRKELTGSLDEVAIAQIRDRLEQLKELEKRKASVINSIREQEKLTPELEAAIAKAESLSEVEDIYLPYKPKRKTRATVAIAKGLEPLAKMLMSQKPMDAIKAAAQFIDKEKGVTSEEEALQGAKDIIAEWVNESQVARVRIRQLFQREGTIYCKVSKGKETEGINYKMYFDYQEALMRAPSHRILAMLRGENEGFLKLSIEPEKENALSALNKIFVKSNHEISSYVAEAVKDSYQRLLQPSMETEFRQMLKQKADEEAIRVFMENLRQLLMAPPLGQKNVLAIDPGFKSGCKIVCLDKQGKLLHNETIYPHPPENQVKQAINKITNLVNAYKIEAIAIGNGTASRETERFVKSIRFETDLIAVVVSENGASVYSASEVARKEFPDYDVTVRGAVSIGRRLMDPLAELVKIDPKSIGVGQYQHDVNQPLLQKSLDDVVMSCVNAVGVEVNTASKELLKYVSGVGETLAQNIIDFRNEHGPFTSRDLLKKVPRFGPKAFEQAAGFLRIHNGNNPLDASAVHPESYNLVDNMAKKLRCSVLDLIKDEQLRKQIELRDFVTEKAGLPTLQDILEELAKPGRDPRTKFGFFEFDKNVHTIDDLREGMVLPGIITNITAFGAFVDIGVHQDGLVHVSQLADKFVKNPMDVVKVHQKVKVKVLEIDMQRRRISLSMKNISENEIAQ